jgi:hypothetical protein
MTTVQRPRKVRVGPFRVTVEKAVADSSRDSLVGRAKRHFRNVEMGPRVKIDPDESVRRSPRGPERGTSLLGRRPLGSGLFGGRGGYDDDLD